MAETAGSPEKREQPDFRVVYLQGENGPRVAWHWNKPGARVDVARQGYGGLYGGLGGNDQTLISTNMGPFIFKDGRCIDVVASREGGDVVAFPVEDAWRNTLVIPIADRTTIGGSSTVFVHSVLIDTGQMQSPPPGGQLMPDVFKMVWDLTDRPYPPGMHGLPHVDAEELAHAGGGD